MPRANTLSSNYAEGGIVPIEDIRRAAAKYNLELPLLEAILRTESSGRYGKKRYEQNVDDYSYGPMQVRLATARRMGFRGDPEELLGEKGLDFGAKYLRRQLNRYGGNVENAVAAYNAGTARLTPMGYTNQKYVDKVLGQILPPPPPIEAPPQWVPSPVPLPGYTDGGFISDLKGGIKNQLDRFRLLGTGLAHPKETLAAFAEEAPGGLPLVPAYLREVLARTGERMKPNALSFIPGLGAPPVDLTAPIGIAAEIVGATPLEAGALETAMSFLVPGGGNVGQSVARAVEESGSKRLGSITGLAKRALTTSLKDILTGSNPKTLSAQVPLETLVRGARRDVRGLGEAGSLAGSVFERALGQVPTQSRVAPGIEMFFPNPIFRQGAGRIEANPSAFHLPEQARTILRHELGHEATGRIAEIIRKGEGMPQLALDLTKKILSAKRTGKEVSGTVLAAYKNALKRAESAEEATRVLNDIFGSAELTPFRAKGNPVREALLSKVGRLEGVSTKPHGNPASERMADIIAILASPGGRQTLPTSVQRRLAKIGLKRGGVVPKR